MKKKKSLIDSIRDGALKVSETATEAAQKIGKHWGEHGDEYKQKAIDTVEQGLLKGGEAVDKVRETPQYQEGVRKTGEAIDAITESETYQGGKEVATGVIEGATDTATGAYYNLQYTDANLKQIETNIENQGGHYQWLNAELAKYDVIILGGETLVSLIDSPDIPQEIEEAYELAYPDEALEYSFTEKARELLGDEESITGFISGVKGKLFELKYVDYLNSGNLPEGYSAELAESANQSGWDIAIKGDDGEIVEVLQAKATDSVSYVKDAIEKYPNIDVVTTDEVYSHLVMSSVNEDITNSSISNLDLEMAVDGSVNAADIPMDFSLPIFTLAFVAFTTYKDQQLNNLMKLRSAGERSAKAYISYIAGTGVGAVTNTWWLGVVGSVGSRWLADRGIIKQKVYTQLKKTEEANQKIINDLKQKLAGFASYV